MNAECQRSVFPLPCRPATNFRKGKLEPAWPFWSSQGACVREVTQAPYVTRGWQDPDQFTAKPSGTRLLASSSSSLWSEGIMTCKSNWLLDPVQVAACGANPQPFVAHGSSVSSYNPNSQMSSHRRAILTARTTPNAHLSCK
jgi:hypothetical protein